jgi:predicted NAD/FAD-binding protein
MSFAVSLGAGAFEYGTSDLNGVFGQRRNTVSPRFWRMLSEIRRFYKEGAAMLSSGAQPEISLGAFLDSRRYSTVFVEGHLLPMGAAIWSTKVEEVREYPMVAFLKFFQSHGLLDFDGRPLWRTVTGGSRAYVKRLTREFRHNIQIENGARRVRRLNGRVIVEDMAGVERAFDEVVIATHADEAAQLLADADPLEKGALSRFRCTKNRAVLHSDPQLMPRRRHVWSSWNYIGDSRARSGENLCVTYWMNRLQSIDPDYPLFVTLNPIREPRRELVHGEFEYSHPYYDAPALEARQRLWDLQGHRNIWYCGSYFGFGFHEDALQSGLAVAESLGGARRPWRVPGEANRIPAGSDGERAAA